ncbi:MAG: YjbQ family protein [Proteobacteria bacterium]|nr:YjbQ family protein [Pseudomonadota bacterium]
MAAHLSSLSEIPPQAIVAATLRVDTRGIGFVEITHEARAFIDRAKAGEGVFLAFLRHTSASLTIQENADPDVQTDLTAALERLAPEMAPWVHTVEGPDDMPAHVKAMLNGVSLHIPVRGGTLALGTWQGLYLVEHRRAPHTRDVIFQFIGSRVEGGGSGD